MAVRLFVLAERSDIESVKVLDDHVPGEDRGEGVRGVGGVGAPPEVDHLLLPDIDT